MKRQFYSFTFAGGPLIIKCQAFLTHSGLAACQTFGCSGISA